MSHIGPFAGGAALVGSPLCEARSIGVRSQAAKHFSAGGLRVNFDSTSDNYEFPWLAPICEVRIDANGWFLGVAPCAIVEGLAAGEFRHPRPSAGKLGTAKAYARLGLGDVLSCFAFLLKGEPREVWERQIAQGSDLSVNCFDFGSSQIGIIAHLTPAHEEGVGISGAGAAECGRDLVVRVRPAALDLAEEIERLSSERAEAAVAGLSGDSSKSDRCFEQIQAIGKEYLARLDLCIAKSLNELGFGSPDELADALSDARTAGQWVSRFLAKNGNRLARDGKYLLWVVRDPEDGEWLAVIAYSPREDVPALVECIAAAKVLVPAAFRDPLLSEQRPPESAARISALPVGIEHLEDLGLLSGLLEEVAVRISPADAETRTRQRLSERGTEALGWYQSFHVYGADAWGVYMRDEAIEDLAVWLLHRMQAKGSNGFACALPTTLRLILEHEFFHAQVDVFALTQELVGGRPLYFSYENQVYEPSLANGALEEALANWEARKTIEPFLWSLRASRSIDQVGIDETLKFVEEVFDHSPKGYRDWRIGANPLAFRAQAAQIVSGKSRPAPPLPPIEGMLRQTPGVLEFQGSVPIWTTHLSALGGALFATPSLREAQRLLRSRGFRPDSGRGKGGHIMWFAQDGGKGFPLPTRDPLSWTVYSNLLDLLGISRKEHLAARQA